MAKRAIATCLLLVACGVPADDETTTSDSDADTSTSTSTSTTVDVTSASASTSASSMTDTTSTTSTASTASTDATSSDETEGDSTSADTSETTGGCAIEPAELTEVEGCAAPVGEPFCSEGQQHVDDGSDVPWMADPPHSGPHYPMWETWGEHDTVVARGNWVHNLEHGGIVLTYRCNDDCPDELAVLREAVEMRPDLRILLTQDPLLPGDRFAAISWTWVHRFDAPDLAELLCFADQHENHAPEDVP